MYSLPQSYNQTSKCKRCISSNAYDNTIQQEPAPVQPKRTRKSRPIQQPVQEKYAGIRIALQQCKTQDSLMELYKQHQNEVTGNTEIKALFTERKLQLNQAV